jgi:hypothetical protein
MKDTLVTSRIQPVRDGACVHLFRRGKLQTKVRLGPNHVHAFITRKDGTIVDLGISKNLLTNVGRDLWAAAFGHATMKGGAVTASSATSATPSGGGMTTDQYKGWRIIMPVTGLTTQPVYGNVGSNSATVVTVDQWWTEADAVGTTPASTSGYIIMPTCTPRFMGLTTDSGAAAAGDTVLATEITTGGCARTKSTYAHTAATATYTMQVVFSVTSTFTAIHKMGLFTAKDTTSAGVMVFETVLNQDATVGNGDTLTVTDTVTLSG